MPGASYRDASEVAEERRRAALERAHAQRRELTPAQLARLPPALREELERLDARLEPEDATASAVLEAEDALDEHARLLVDARAVISALDKEKRRERHDRALESIRRRLTRRPFYRALAIVALLAAAFGVPTYLVARNRADEGCRRSEDCKAWGTCAADRFLHCAPASDGDCSRSNACREMGHCHVVRGYCGARDDDDCAGSQGCESLGLCKAFQGSCQHH